MPRPLRLLCALSGCCAGTFAAEFPTPRNSGPNDVAPAMSAEEARAALTLPPGFGATVFAAEPDIQNPIAMAWDARGRLWVAENYTYAERGVRWDLQNRDRVLIFEDRTGEGRFTSRRVFVDNVQRLTSVALGHGGAWLMCPPQLLFIPDRDGDGSPDGAAEVVLDGFGTQDANYHTVANGLRFGPDGWLYGRCGAASIGEIGPPGAAAESRVPQRGAIWRYHPTRRIFEALSAGTTNPWGHDWDRHGELFFINTVNGHLWHAITGAHYARPHTLDPNPHVYSLIDQHADHYHFLNVDAAAWTRSKDGAANAQGGGHAHVGMMIYQGDNWPAEYRDALFTLNFHGRRINRERLERAGSGYVGRHGDEKFLFGDPWFRGIELGYGPDGGVFVLDWSDLGECHNALGVNRRTGRIFKIVHGHPARSGPADLTRLTPRELAALHTHASEWFVRQARIELASRAGAGTDTRDASAALREMFAQSSDVPRQLRALWTLYAMGATDAAFLRGLLRHADEHVRAWAIRLLTDAWPLDTVMSARPLQPERAEPELVAEFVSLARRESSAFVRLALTTTLQRLPRGERVPLATALAARAEDAQDHNLPALLWYGLIGAAEVDPAGVARVAAECELPLTRRHIVRRLAEELDRNPTVLDVLLAAAAKKAGPHQEDIIAGLALGLAGTQRLPPPAGWAGFVASIAPSAPAQLHEHVRSLSVLFGEGRALAEVTAVALDSRADLGARKSALRALIEARPPDLQSICERTVLVRGLGLIAAQGLTLFDSPQAANRLAAAYSILHPHERPGLISSLVSRPVFARALLQQIVAGRIPRGELTPFHARQIASLQDAALTRQLVETWGELRETSGEKRALIEQLKRELSRDALAAANKGAGRVVFNQLCANCHRLYGEGQSLAPDLTGAGRHDLDYLLDNIADPGAVVTADFRNTIVKLKDGRTLNGFIIRRTPRTLELRSMTETLTLAAADVDTVETSSQSTMPDGLLESLTAAQRRDLIAYLMHPTQVPLPASP